MKEFSQFRQTLQESSPTPGAMPPNILILRRKSVRQFPGQMVALYYNDKLDQYFSIPYGPGEESIITPSSLKESTQEELSECVIGHLRDVVDFKHNKPITHKDGSHTKVDPTTAKALVTVHDALKPEYQEKFKDMIHHSKPKFHKAVDFAWSQVK